MKITTPDFEDSILSVIIVTHNDADIIEKRIMQINKTLVLLGLNYEILIIENNSIDQTLEKIIALEKVMKFTRILVLSKTYEKSIALSAGLDSCIGDFAIILDLYTDPVEMIPYILVNKLLNGNDVVIGKSSRDIIKYGPMSQLFLKCVEKYSSHGFFYRQNYLLGLSRKAINSIIRTRRKSRNLAYIHSLIGLRKQIINYQPLRKYAYKLKKENLFQLIASVFDISISNSFRPIRLISYSGMIFSLLYLLYVAVIICLALFFGMRDILPKGWATLSTILGVMFFLLFSLLTIMSEYIVRILGETRNEPFYFVSEEINKSSITPKKNILNIT